MKLLKDQGRHMNADLPAAKQCAQFRTQGGAYPTSAHACSHSNQPAQLRSIRHSSALWLAVWSLRPCISCSAALRHASSPNNLVCSHSAIAHTALACSSLSRRYDPSAAAASFHCDATSRGQIARAAAIMRPARSSLHSAMLAGTAACPEITPQPGLRSSSCVSICRSSSNSPCTATISRRMQAVAMQGSGGKLLAVTGAVLARTAQQQIAMRQHTIQAHTVPHQQQHRCVQASSWQGHDGEDGSMLSAGDDRGSREGHYISSVQNAYVKHCVKLRTSSKARAESGTFLLVGSELLTEAAAGGAAELNVVTLILPERPAFVSSHHPKPRHPVPAGLRARRTATVTEQVMRKLTGLETVACVGAVAELALPALADFSTWQSAAASTAAAPEAAEADFIGARAPLRAARDDAAAPEAAEADSIGAQASLRAAHDDMPPLSPAAAQHRPLHHLQQQHQQQQEEELDRSSNSNSRLLGPKQHSAPSSDMSSGSPWPPSAGLQQHAHPHPSAAQVEGRPGRVLRRLLVLDAVQDPGNLGTLLRSALAFGWDGVWLLPGCCDPFNDKAIRASRGAVLRLPIGMGDVRQLSVLAERMALRMLAADMEGSGLALSGSTGSAVGVDGLLHDAQASADVTQETVAPPTSGYGGGHWGGQSVALVLGSEGQGLSPDIQAMCTPVAVPMTAGSMESLNVGIAGGVLMFMLSEGCNVLVERLRTLAR